MDPFGYMGHFRILANKLPSIVNTFSIIGKEKKSLPIPKNKQGLYLFIRRVGAQL
jgi:hypothetical protein